MRQILYTALIVTCSRINRARSASSRWPHMLSVFACLGLILLDGVNVYAQKITPPPGFVPDQEDESAPESLPEPGVYGGRDERALPDESPGRTRYPEWNALPRQRIDEDLEKGQERFSPRETDRYVPFQSPPQPQPVLFPADEFALPRAWFRAEALYWWTKAAPVPVPVVTLGSAADSIPGAIGQPGTSVLLGNQSIRLPARGGGRFTLGFSLDDEQTWGIEGSYLFLANTSVTKGVTSDGSPGSAILAFPFYNPLFPGEDSSSIALPGSFAGTATLNVQSYLQGAELNLLRNTQMTGDVRYDLLGGLRYVNLQENLNFETDSPNVAPNPPAFFNTFDQFHTRNNFYGAQFGARASYDNNRLFMNATGKLAIGGTAETVFVNGGTFTNAGGGYSSAAGSYFSQPTNLGSLTRDRFAIVPELNLNVGVRLSPWASLTMGYSFLYVSSVARPGDQLDHVINPSQAPAITNNPPNLFGPARPGLNVHSSDFWVQGLNFAMEFRY